MNVSTIYYLDGNIDAFAGAVAHHQAIMKRNNHNNCVYKPLNPTSFKRTLIPDSIDYGSNHRAIFLGVTPPTDTIEYMITQGTSVFIIDHRSSAYDKIITLPQEVVLTKKKFYFLLSDKMTCASMVKTLGDVIHNPWIYRNEKLVFEANDKQLGKLLTNTSLHTRINRDRMNDLYDCIETYSLHDSTNPLYEQSRYVHAYLKSMRVTKTPLYDFEMNCMRVGLDVMCDQGHTIVDAHWSIALKCYQDAWRETVVTNAGNTVRVIVGNPPNELSYMFSEVCEHLNKEHEKIMSVVYTPKLHPRSIGGGLFRFKGKGVSCKDVARAFDCHGDDLACVGEYNPEYPVTIGNIVQEIIDKVVTLC